MPSLLPLLQYRYEMAAEDYLRRLPLEHFMEATPQGTQREITLASLSLVKAKRPEIQFFNELLVQYPLPDSDEVGQVVPDNMVVLRNEPIHAIGSYDVPLQPSRPFWVIEYVSKNSKRKDYTASFHKYEAELKVPFCLMFYPEAQDLKLYRRGRTEYRLVRPNRQHRFPIPKLELELGLLDGWVRFWFQGKLLALPPELQKQLEEVQGRLAETQRQLQERDRQLQERDRQLQERDRQLLQAEQARQAAEAELARLRAGRKQRKRGQP